MGNTLLNQKFGLDSLFGREFQNQKGKRKKQLSWQFFVKQCALKFSTFS